MARTPEQRKKNARKYGRRRDVLEAFGSGHKYDAIVERLNRDLVTAGAPADVRRRLAARLAAATDPHARRAAVSEALEIIETLET